MMVDKEMRNLNAMARVSENAYFRNGKPIVLESYCAYYDILGLAEMLQPASKSKRRERKLFGEIYPIISGKNPQFAELDLPQEFLERGVIILQFSDNAIIGCPQKSKDGRHLVKEITPLIAQLALNQLALATDGWFIRGGITTGLLFIDKRIAFGSALIEAHLLETNKANNPRIVLSSKLGARLSKIISENSVFRQSIVDRLFLRDQDGQIFVNYLGVCLPTNLPDLSLVKKHKTILEGKLVAYRSRPRIWAKYLWTANYHNYIVKMHLKDPQYKKHRSALTTCIIGNQAVSYNFNRIF